MDLKQFSRHYDHLLHDVSALKRAICNKLVYQIAKNPASARAEDWLMAELEVPDHERAPEADAAFGQRFAAPLGD